ncbi:hypothetical protein [Novosphingobium sp.]|uniref:hypothetical protein n=1 Tax=Novosphingobium sp. TaxID=1874826 RepID=UPI0025E3AC81|nr:hypothetical protein [Novosphingobium sp.]
MRDTRRRSMRLGWVLASLAAAAALWSTPAYAGPPFVTDDPEPTDYHKWEIYNFVGGSREGGVTSADMGLDLNYGAVKDVQLTMVLPLHVETGAPLDTGDIQLAAKFKLLHQKADTASVDLTFFPRVFVPTGRGSRHAQLLLPIWVQRDFGKTTVFGGGGYTINPGAGNRDFWVQGVVVTREVRKGFQVGVEYYGQGPGAIGDRRIDGVNFGALIHLSGPYSLIGSFGQGLNRRQTTFYTALKLDF